jgi:hypothetical protein
MAPRQGDDIMSTQTLLAAAAVLAAVALLG